MDKKVIYFIDDEELLCEAFAEFFSNDKLHVLTFTEHEEAIESAKQTKPDLVLIDYRLKGITGEQVALSLDKEIKKILMTGELQIDLPSCFDEMIKKPYRLSQLSTLLEKYLGVPM